jgi:hypothetical protein
MENNHLKHQADHITDDVTHHTNPLHADLTKNTPSHQSTQHTWGPGFKGLCPPFPQAVAQVALQPLVMAAGSDAGAVGGIARPHVLPFGDMSFVVERLCDLKVAFDRHVILESKYNSELHIILPELFQHVYHRPLVVPHWCGQALPTHTPLCPWDDVWHKAIQISMVGPLGKIPHGVERPVWLPSGDLTAVLAFLKALKTKFDEGAIPEARYHAGVDISLAAIFHYTYAGLAE